MTYKTYTLPNGIRIVHVSSQNNVCYCGLIINAGTRDEQPNEYGIAHFIEHVIFKGTNKRRAYHILNRLDEVGGELNAYTTKEETAVHAAFLSDDFERATELIADMVFNSTFPEKELAKEKIVIADEISSYKDTPSELIFDDFEDKLFAGSPMGHNILGTVESLASFTGAEVRQFMQRCYNTDQMVFSVLGNLKWEKIIRIAEKYFGCIAENKRTRTREKNGNSTFFRERQNRETHQGHVVLGHIAPSCFENSRLPMFVLNNIIGGPCMNSRLSLILRERNGIGYNVETEYTPYTDIGLFTVYFGTDSDNIDKSLRIVERELTRICNEPMTEIQLNKVKRQFIGQLLMSTDNGESQMLSVGRSVLLYGEADDIQTSCLRIKDVSADDIINVAREVIVPEKLSQLIYF